MASAKQYTELCPAHFRDEMCLRGKTCTFAHEAPPPNAVVEDTKPKSSWDKFTGGNKLGRQTL